MVDEQIVARGITDPAVLAALGDVPRHLLVPLEARPEAYDDHPLDLGWGQTISQPYIVALMTERLQVAPGQRVLEIGTGSGYQAALLDRLGAAVFSLELVPPLAERATAVLARLAYDRVRVRCADGYLGWPEEAPFDRVVLTAAPPELPPALLAQLAPGGRLVAPVGTDLQRLVLVERAADGTLSTSHVEWVRFVPMVHGAPAP
jgi:protein-L-isoaspartate(D-aspartate) O-methyltransferase